jgi:hypothetical protein
MSNRKTFRSVAIPALLLALLVFAMTLGAVAHSHAGATESNCSICHLNHQPFDQPLVADSEPSLSQVGVQLDIAEPTDPPFQPAPRLPARAPPAI